MGDNDVKMISNDIFHQPCHIAMPDLWHSYCALVGRLPHAADHWLVIDVINAMQRSFCEAPQELKQQRRSCVKCGDVGDYHDTP